MDHFTEPNDDNDILTFKLSDVITEELPDFDIDNVRDIITYTSDKVSEMSTKRENGMGPTLGDEVLINIYSDLKSKYGLTNLDFKDFNALIRDIVSETRTESQLAEILLSKLTSSITRRTQTKLVININRLIDRATTIIEQTLSNEELVTGEVIAGVNSLFAWNDKLKEMRAEAEMRYSDPDKALDILANQSKIDQMNDKNQDLKNKMIRKLLDDID